MRFVLGLAGLTGGVLLLTLLDFVELLCVNFTILDLLGWMRWLWFS